MQNTLGLVQVFTGNGKGKTTTALGIAFRAAGHGLKVCVIQFLKGGSYLGELKTAKKIPEIKFYQFGSDCLHEERIVDGELNCNGCKECFLLKQEDKENSRNALALAEKILSGNDCDILILDEINLAIDQALISLDDALKLIKIKPKNIELIFTGRNAPKELIDKADLVTVFRHLKHPFDEGIGSRKGIEY